MRRILLVLLALTLLSGCGGADASLFATAVQNTQNAGGAEVAFQWNYNLPGRDTPVVMTGTGFEDASKGKARITAQLPAEIPGGGEIEAIMDGTVMYMRSPLLRNELGGKEWFKLDLARTSESLGLDMGSVGQLGQSTKQQLDALAQVSDGVTDHGREQVRGVDATHYSATVDLHKLSGDAADNLIELSGDDAIDVDVWIDDDQRIRRMEWAQTMPAGGLEMTMVMEYVRFGVPVDIDIPDDDEVFDATDLAVQGIENELD